jgi:peptidoglycan-associated lipoprotein
VTLLLGAACSKKNIQATVDAQEGKAPVVAKLEPPPPAKPEPQPPEPPASASKSEPLTGFKPTLKGAAPPEEPVSGGTVVAKAEPSESAPRRVQEMQQEQAAKTAADVAGTELEDIYFGFDSWKIVERAKQTLERDATWLKANPDQKLTIEGHCDERGTLEYNLVLGEKRAKAVKHYLTDLGIDAGRLHVTSFGKEKPFCMEHQEDCYQKNRRGHLVGRAQ